MGANLRDEVLFHRAVGSLKIAHLSPEDIGPTATKIVVYKISLNAG